MTDGRQRDDSCSPAEQVPPRAASNLADCNLLFGILALQMDFISRDALIAAMHAWVLQKSRKLGDILAEQGKLSQDRHKLLEALVGEHLKQHGNDPQQSLAAVSSLRSIRDELSQIADPDLEASLACVPAQSADSALATTLGSPTSAGYRFIILRPHAKGGLGQVYVARDQELHREVALKEIQPHCADNPHNRARFLLEAEITGGLEHPGIVPVYGLGQYDDGRPFYAMRFIRGDSLKDAIKRFHAPPENGGGKRPGLWEHNLEFRKLLGRFIDVCNAIEYAHSRGVLHRDLKPGNIMLGKYGETLVVDWGLAKPVGRPESAIDSDEATLKPSGTESALTVMGTVVGTPAYMSPEQAAGRLDDLGPATDVYSLGATLYSVLTGHAPLELADNQDALRRIEQGNFPHPRNRRPGIPRALESICLKAMSVRPLDRYASPKALADDLEHWLANERVSACRESLPGKLARLARRHRSWTFAAAVLLVLVTIGSTVGTLLVNEARRQEASAKTAALQAKDRATEAETKAQSAALKGLRTAASASLSNVEMLRRVDEAPEQKIKVLDMIRESAGLRGQAESLLSQSGFSEDVVREERAFWDRHVEMLRQEAIEWLFSPRLKRSRVIALPIKGPSYESPLFAIGPDGDKFAVAGTNELVVLSFSGAVLHRYTVPSTTDLRGDLRFTSNDQLEYHSTLESMTWTLPEGALVRIRKTTPLEPPRPKPPPVARNADWEATLEDKLVLRIRQIHGDQAQRAIYLSDVKRYSSTSVDDCSLAFGDDPRTLFVLTRSELYFVDVATGIFTSARLATGAWDRRLAPVPGGVVVPDKVGESWQLVFWKADPSAIQRRGISHPGAVQDLLLAGDGTLVTGCSDGALSAWIEDRSLWRVETPVRGSSFRSDGAPLRSWGFFTGGAQSIFVARGEYKPMRRACYSSDDGRLLRDFPGGNAGEIVAVSKDDRLAVVATRKDATRAAVPAVLQSDLEFEAGSESAVTLQVWSLEQNLVLGTLGDYTLRTSRSSEVVFSPQGRWLVLRNRQTRQLEIWRLSDLQRMGTIPQPEAEFSCDFDAEEERFVVSARGAGEALSIGEPNLQPKFLAHLETGKILCMLEPAVSVSRVYLSSDGEYLIGVRSQGRRGPFQLTQWKLSDGKAAALGNTAWSDDSYGSGGPKVYFQPGAKGNRAFLVGLQARPTVAAGSLMHAELWDLTEQKLLREFTSHEAASVPIASYPVGLDYEVVRLLGGKDNICWRWEDGTDAAPSGALVSPDDAQVEYLPDRRLNWALSHRQDGLYFRTASTAPVLLAGTPGRQSEEVKGTVRATMSPDTKSLHVKIFSHEAIAGGVWASDGRSVATIPPGHEFQVFDATGNWYVTIALARQEAIIWNARTGEPKHTISAPFLEPRHWRPLGTPAYFQSSGLLKVHPQGDRLAVLTKSGLLLWSAAENRLSGEIGWSEHLKPVTACAQSSVGEFIVSGDEAGRVLVWGRKDGKFLRSVNAHDEGVTALAADPSGRSFISAAANGEVCAWNLEGQRIWQFKAGPRAAVIARLMHLPSGEVLAAGGDKGRVLFLKASSGDFLGSIGADRSAIRALGFSPDGALMVVATAAGDVQVWNTEQSNPLAIWNVGVAINDLAFAGDRLLAVATNQLEFRALPGGQRLWFLPAANPPVKRVQINPARREMVVSEDGNTVVGYALDDIAGQLSAMGLAPPEARPDNTASVPRITTERWERALAIHQRLLEEQGKKSQEQAERHDQRQEWRQAAAEYARAIEIDPSNDLLMRRRAAANAALSQWDDAVKDLSAVLQKTPGDVDSLLLRATCYEKLENRPKAFEDSVAAIEIAPERAAPWRYRAQVFAGIKYWGHALKDYERAAELDPDHAETWHRLGRCATQLQKWSDAKRAYAKAVELLVGEQGPATQGSKEPSLVVSANNDLAWLLATCPDDEVRDGALAVRSATRACELTQWRNPSYLDSLAAAYAQTEAFTEAVRWQNEAIKLTPESDRARFRERLELYQAGKPYRQPIRPSPSPAQPGFCP